MGKGEKDRSWEGPLDNAGPQSTGESDKLDEFWNLTYLKEVFEGTSQILETQAEKVSKKPQQFSPQLYQIRLSLA